MVDLVGAAMFALDRPHLEAALRGERRDYTCTVVDGAGAGHRVRVDLVPDVVDGDVVGFVSQVTDVPADTTPDPDSDGALSMLAATMDFAPIGKAV